MRFCINDSNSELTTAMPLHPPPKFPEVQPARVLSSVTDFRKLLHGVHELTDGICVFPCHFDPTVHSRIWKNFGEFGAKFNERRYFL